MTETCWIFDSYSRPETLRETMGLDVDEMRSRAGAAGSAELTGLGLCTKFPYTQYQRPFTLREYLRSLEIEQLEADFQPLAMLRTRSASCNGIVYWPLNKGGPALRLRLRRLRGASADGLLRRPTPLRGPRAWHLPRRGGRASRRRELDRPHGRRTADADARRQRRH